MKTIILTESQVYGIIEEQMLNESFGDILEKVAAGVLSVYVACAMIQGCHHMSQQKKDYLKAQVEQVANNGNKNEDQELLNSVAAQAEKTDTIDNKGGQWRRISDKAIVTVYNAVPEQCNTDVNHTASMFRLDLKNPEKHKIVALERTFMQKNGIEFGDLIMIKGTYMGLQDGVFQVQDLMNKRFAGMDKVDVLVSNNVKYGGTAKDTTAEIYVLNNPDEKKTEYTKSMAPQAPKVKAKK
jgi:hypothetical protein